MAKMLATDFFEHLGQHYHLIVNYFFHFPEVSTGLQGCPQLSQGLCSQELSRRIPDCWDPPDSCLGDCVHQDCQESPGLSGSSGQLSWGPCSLGLSGESRTVGILRAVVSGALFTRTVRKNPDCLSQGLSELCSPGLSRGSRTVLSGSSHQWSQELCLPGLSGIF